MASAGEGSFFFAGGVAVAVPVGLAAGAAGAAGAGAPGAAAAGGFGGVGFEGAGGPAVGSLFSDIAISGSGLFQE